MAGKATTGGHSARETAKQAKETAENKAAFLEAFAKHVTVLASCKAAGVSRSAVYKWRDLDDAFAEAFQEVDDANVEAAEAALYEMAVTGTERVKLDKEGDVVESWTERDPQLLQFLLKARRPNVYRDRATVEHTGPEGGAVKVEHTHDLSKLSVDRIRELRSILAEASPDAPA